MDTKPNGPHDQRSEYLKKSLSHRSTKRHQFEVGLVLILDILRDLMYRDQTLQGKIFKTRFLRRDLRREWSFSGGKGVFLAQKYIHK
jgi:hypothetical protein